MTTDSPIPPQAEPQVIPETVTAAQDKPAEYKPWAGQERVVSTLFLIGGAVTFVGLQIDSKLFVGVGAALLFAGFAVFARVGARKRGKRIEQRAINRLVMPNGWAAQPNYLVPGLGDVDLFVTGPGGARYVIEIKSHKNVSFQKAGILFGSDKLLASGKPITPDPLAQVQKAANRLDAKAVIWFPEAKEKKRYRTKNGTLIVQGGGHSLLVGLGAKSWFSFF